jgi:hypothetical protein
MLLHMPTKSSLHIVRSLLLIAVACPALRAQTTATPASPAMETAAQLRDRIPPAQKQQLDDAMKAFSAGQYAGAITTLNLLREKHPRDPVLAKFFAEASIDTGDDASAMTALKPIVQADTTDWQAASLLARACAEAGDATCRDAQMAQIAALHTQGITPPNFREYTVEHVKTGANTVTIFASVEPYSLYKIYNKAKVTNADGKLFLTITLESADIDQASFARSHPKEAAAGMRTFTLDAYAETGQNAAGQRTQTHYTFAFLNGQPTYTDLREQFLKIAGGKGSALSSRTGLIVQ